MTTLTFLESEEHYSIYRESDGTIVYLAHGTRKRLVPFENLNLNLLWSDYRNARLAQHRIADHVEFLDELRALTIEPDYVDEVRFCPDCQHVGVEENFYGVDDGTIVCEGCYDNYSECASCEGMFDAMRNSLSTTLHGTRVCESCLENYYTWCDHCEGYRHDESTDHDHDRGCNCEVPSGPAFTVRNDGEPPLANDTEVTVTLPAGVISDVGLCAIRNYLQSVGYETSVDEDGNYLPNPQRIKYVELSWEVSELGDKWQTKEGNFTKRLSRHAYKKHGIKLPPRVLSQVGCIARDHSTAADFLIAVTRDLNMPAEEFAHEDSCWWQSYESSRCALKSNGGFGLRSFKKVNDEYSVVTGRAWVMPLVLTDDEDSTSQLVPTFDTLTPDAFIVFNGYGALGGPYVPARIVSHMAGMTYRKVGFTASPMYINNDSGYLVAPEEIACNYTDGTLSLGSLDPHSNLFRNEKKVLTNAA